uniref:Uncharacterized protein n=1 Tax=Candidatus Kentrum sp. FM TaxID=2126340 RepID=A0A450VRZ8_9GAMM|nr:MAG: hypothetical protein BECKFM1743C_GA0114222_1005610 [Candidatus Kentron sp. FM]VFJ48209.1 MAG: hypothetical protein BECKFM1743A_GA0114220_100562 [Candidatus Kentron sp. FM]VFK07535.1 MAG: hypothetical protein BECKFM1743B_GA0114221_1004312 [Candidatus Kentron sp. FM]
MKKIAPKPIIGYTVALLLIGASSTATARDLISTLAQGIDATAASPSELEGRGTTVGTSTGSRGTTGDGENSGDTSTGGRDTGSGNTGGRTIGGDTDVSGTRGAISK